MKAFLTSSSGLVPRVYRHHYNFFRECISLLYIFNVVIFIYLFYFSMAYKASKDCFLCYYLSCVLKSGWGYVIRFQFIIIEYTITSALGSVFYNMIPQNKVEVCFCISQNKVQRWSAQGCFGGSTIISGSESFCLSAPSSQSMAWVSKVTS